MKSVLYAFAAAAVLALSAPAGSASPYPQANKYFQLRDRSAQVVTELSELDLQTQPQRFAGKLIEVRGVVKACIDSNTGTTILVQGHENTPAAETTATVSLPPGKQLSEWPFLDIGASVRVLCQVVLMNAEPGASGPASGTLELVVPVQEHEARVVDDARARAEKEAAIRRAAEARQKASQRAMASRGGAAASAVRRGAPQFTRAQVVELYARAVRHFNRRLDMSEARSIAHTILEYSIKYDLDARLVMAVIACESNFNQYAVSPVGAQGLGQLMPGTAGDLGVGDAFNVRQNLEGATRLLKNHIKNMEKGGRPSLEAVKLALACYNAGAGAVKKYKGIPPYRETQNYVRKIVRLYWQMLPPADRKGWTPD